MHFQLLNKLNFNFIISDIPSLLMELKGKKQCFELNV